MLGGLSRHKISRENGKIFVPVFNILFFSNVFLNEVGKIQNTSPWSLHDPWEIFGMFLATYYKYSDLKKHTSKKTLGDIIKSHDMHPPENGILIEIYCAINIILQK
ncbi:hypothetical protein [Novacetimonas hansenii]|uniref:Uncharacterized protein n=1 Tax=Novacetimonas hansenii TaxID=436 RepID=A0AAW5EV21_NOVHA|nr:hypothetical protein [Novacetimonas hansenii]MCJ8354175.1 hypothetical protein [Novacetimonas hansenii]